MAGRKRQPTSTRTAKSTSKTAPKRDLRAEILGVNVRSIDWMVRLPPERVLKPGTPTDDHIRVPIREAQQILRGTVRLVADLPTSASSDVVWVKGNSELVVHTDRIGIACDNGLITISVPVSCDQLSDRA